MELARLGGMRFVHCDRHGIVIYAILSGTQTQCLRNLGLVECPSQQPFLISMSGEEIHPIQSLRKSVIPNVSTSHGSLVC